METHENETHRGRPRWFGAAVLAAVLLLVGLAGWGIRALVTGDEPTSPGASSSQTDNAPAGGNTTGAAAPAGGEKFAWDCQANLSSDSVSVKDKAPAVDEWVAAGYNVVPTSAQFGGCEKRKSGLRVGYAHSEAGALIAAATYAMAVDPSVSEEASDNPDVAIVEGPNRDRIEEKAKRIRDGVEQGTDGSASASSTLIGYSQDHYSNDAATYLLIYSLPSGSGLTQKVAVQADLVWDNGDWKLDPASGTDLMTSDQYQGQPYVDWGPKS